MRLPYVQLFNWMWPFLAGNYNGGYWYPAQDPAFSDVQNSTYPQIQVCMHVLLDLGFKAHHNCLKNF